MTQQLFDFLSRPEVLVIGLGIAIFLALYWVIRGAPIGQAAAEEPTEAPSPGRRDRAGAAAVFGFLAVMAGAIVAGRFGIPWSLPVFAVGFGLILRVQKMSRAYRHVSPTLRRVSEFSSTALSISLLGGILVLANVFAFKYGGRAIDFTRDEAFSLSSKSVNLVQSLKVPLKFTLKFGRDRQARRFQDLVTHLVELYHAENPQRIEVTRIDPYKPAAGGDYTDLLKRVPDLAVIQGDAIVMEYGESPDIRHSVIDTRNLFRDSTNQGGGPISTSFSGEDVVTSALGRFVEGKRLQIGYSSGHGEPSLDEFNPQLADGLGIWRTRLGSFGIDAVALNLLANDVSDSIEVVIIVGPKRAFERVEVERLLAALAKGKPMLLVMNGQVPTGLDPLLSKHNLAFEPGTIRDDQLNALNNHDVVATLPVRQGDSTLSDSLLGMQFVVPRASPLYVVGTKPLKAGQAKPEVNPAMVIAPFLRTAPTSYVLGSGTPAQEKGPFIVGAAVTERGDPATGVKSRPRMVALSSGDMATNYFYATNSDVLMNSIQWLRGRTESAGVEPKIHTSTLFVADPNLRFRLHVIPTIVSFVLIVGLGVTTYLARRS